jgi:membrane protein
VTEAADRGKPGSMEHWQRIRRFFGKELWTLSTRDLPIYRRIPMKALKLAILAFRGFFKGKAGLRATALTLHTLLSIVPVLALLFGIAKGFGLDRRMQHWLLSHFPQQEEVLKQALGFAESAIENTQGGLIAGAGVLFLIYTVIRVIGQIEQSMNHIWSISKSRSLSRKFSDYLSLILIGPFLIIGASSLNVLISTWVDRATEAAPFSDVLGPVARAAVRPLPLLMLWLLFTFTYVFMPNTKVKIASGMIGGAVAALLYQIAQTLYISLQVGVSRNSAIYGSFAALPFFILWVQISWNIVLFGAELTQQHQSYDSNETEEAAPDLSFRTIKRIGLDICALVLGRFREGKDALTAERIGTELALPSRVLNMVLAKLTDSGLLAETAPRKDGGEPAYQPARASELLTSAAILEALEKQGEDLARRAEKRTGPGEEILSRIESRIRDAEGSLAIHSVP